MVFVLFVMPAVAVGLKGIAEGVENWRLARDVENNKQHKVTVSKTVLLNTEEIEDFVQSTLSGDAETADKIYNRGQQKWSAAQGR